MFGFHPVSTKETNFIIINAKYRTTLAVFRLETRGYLVLSYHAEVYRSGTAQHGDAGRVKSSNDLPKQAPTEEGTHTQETSG